MTDTALSATQLRILTKLAMLGPLSQRRLSEETGLALSAAQYQVRRLANAGLIGVMDGKFGARLASLNLYGAIRLISAKGKLNKESMENQKAFVKRLASKWTILSLIIFSVWKRFKDEKILSVATLILTEACSNIDARYGMLMDLMMESASDASAPKETDQGWAVEEHLMNLLSEEFFVTVPARLLANNRLPDSNVWVKLVHDLPLYKDHRELAAKVYQQNRKQADAAHNYLKRLEGQQLNGQ